MSLNKKSNLLIKLIPIILCLQISNINAANIKSLFSFSVLGAPLFGGINEDNEIDAVTSATKIGGKAGIRAEAAFKRRLIFETGLEYTSFNQEIEYLDTVKDFNGKWKISFHELRIPLTYNVHIGKNKKDNPLFILRIGGYFGIVVQDNCEDNGDVPEYTSDPIEGGLVLSWAVYPFTIGKHISPAILIDMERGTSKFWEDPYTGGDGMGVSRTSMISFGILLRMGNF